MDRIRIPFTEHVAKIDQEPCPAWGLYDGQVMLRCGQCRKPAGSLINHSIDADGTVNASILCGNSVYDERGRHECGWHVWGILDGWTRGVKPAGEARIG
jgi:hypothetical protein